MKKEKDFGTGFIYGQRKLASYLMELTIENVSDYQWVLSHLKEVSEGREVVQNTAVGFMPLTNEQESK